MIEVAKITTLKFNDKVYEKLKKLEHGTKWPVVYILYNKKEAYIGETKDACLRTHQHLASEERKKLKNISIITDNTFNKSCTLDLESFLIKHMAADKKFQLQNGNNGLQDHNYYQKEIYTKEFEKIWLQLKGKGLVKNDLKRIVNTDLFKFSPYKSLSVDQYMVVNDILSILAEDVNHGNQSTFLVHGGSGTGKTVLGIYIVKLLSHIKEQDKIEENQIDKNLSDILKMNNALGDFKIGLVVPMRNLRATLKRVFKDIKGLNSKMVLSPHDVGKNDIIYDLLIIDEAHRLRRRKNLTQYKTFD